MKKLNKKKIKWTIREVERRDVGVWTIAQQNNITPRWARELPKKYKNKEIILRKPGRKPKPITKEERTIVIETYKEYFVCATMMEQILNEKGIHIGHNKIHRIMLEKGLAKKEKNKQKIRRYKCYERKHSNSLWHTDWLQYKVRWYILFEDDASRFITGSGMFPNRSSNNAWKVFKKTIKYGIPKQLHSDNDSTFRANEQKGKRKGECDYQKKIKEIGVQQIFARVHRPQGNGKMEKLNGTIKKLMRKGLSFDNAIKHYNYKKPHLGLRNGKLRTPYRAFLDKMRN